MDYGHKWTDEELKKLERRISREYTQAAKEIEQKMKTYVSKFATKDKIKLAELQAGKITQAQYDKWRLGQLMMTNRWIEMRATLTEDLMKTKEKTDSMTKEFSYDAYAMNHNYGTFEVEKGSLIDTSYTLYDRNTVERLVRDDPDMLPPPGKKVSQAIREGKAERWDKQKIQSVMTQSILQGESMPKIAKRLAEAVSDADMKAAIRNARTMTTGAENAGRQDSYKRAEKMGIQMEQMWVATLDGRTRHEHRLLDGQRRAIDEPFEVAGEKIRFPGDPTAEPGLVYNCRCTLIGIVDGMDVDSTLAEMHTDDKLNGMTYEEWKNGHKKQQKKTPAANVGTSNVAKACARENIDYLEPKALKKTLSAQDIYTKLAGGDQTKGSCASLSLAYTANRGGLDVRDFRGGKSQAVFCRTVYLSEIAQLPGVDGHVEKNTNDFKAANTLLGLVEKGKEYLLGIGRHMAVIRKAEDGGFQYLEMQSAWQTGFMPLNKDVLKRRFRCQRSHTTLGMKYEASSELIEVQSLSKNDEFKHLIGYINTAAGKENKGGNGFEK